MMPRRSSYFLALFSEQSWQEFRAHGGKVYGTTKNRLTRAQKLAPGDYLLCYISRWMVFAGALQITGSARYEETPLYKQDVFPVRLDVDVVIAVDPYDGVPIEELLEELQIFRRMRNPNKWAGFFLTAFNQFPQVDGEIVLEMLKLSERFQ